MFEFTTATGKKVQLNILAWVAWLVVVTGMVLQNPWLFAAGALYILADSNYNGRAGQKE